MAHRHRVIVNGRPIGARRKRVSRLPERTELHRVLEHDLGHAVERRSSWGSTPVRSLESPHNSIHLAVGGFDIRGVFDASPIDGANGDMGETRIRPLSIPSFTFIIASSTACSGSGRNGTDPPTHWTSLEVSRHELGGLPKPDARHRPRLWLNLSTPLNPFKKIVDGQEWPYTSRDCINIETQLGFTYGEAPGRRRCDRA